MERQTRRYRQLLCIFCGESFIQHRALQRHLLCHHTCSRCQEATPNLNSHSCQEILHASGPSFDTTPFRLESSSMSSVLQVYVYDITSREVSIEQLFRNNIDSLTNLLKNVLLTNRSVKFQINLKLTMRESVTLHVEYKYFNSGYHILLHPNSIEPLVTSCRNQITTQLESFVEMGSSWNVIDITRMGVNIALYRPFGGRANVPLPPPLRRKRGIANLAVHNYCFNYCMMACRLKLKRKADVERLSSYNRFLENNMENQIINFNGIPKEVSVLEIEKFTRQNSDFSVNAFGFSENTVYPLHITPNKKEFHADVLFFYNEEVSKGHWLYIFDFSAFMSNGHDRRYFCVYCLNAFSTEIKRDDHSQHCKKGGVRKLEFYPEKTFEKVALHEFSLPRSVVIYFDFETINEKGLSHRSQHTTFDGSLKPISFSYLVVSSKRVLEYGHFVGERADKVFVKTVNKLANMYLPRTQEYKNNMIVTQDGLDRCDSNICCICNNRIQPGESISRHHNHAAYEVSNIPPGEIYGLSHSNCNLQLRTERYIPCISHNFSRFDSLQLIRGLNDVASDNIRCVAKSANQFLTITFNGVQFLDSYMHLPFALKELVLILRNSGIHHFEVTQYVFGNYMNLLDDLIRKQIFCYDYITKENLFQKIKTLPPKFVFFNSLTEEHITDQEYEFANDIFRVFGCDSLAQYLNIYCLLDTCLLSDVFRNHQKLCYQMYKIEPLNFLSCSAMSFRTVLGISGQELEYISCPDIYLMSRRALRGGITNYSDRLAYANYDDREDFDNSKPVSSIMQLDVCQLYSKCMTYKLPVGNYRLLSQEEIERFNPMEIDDDGDIGYLLAVDIKIDPSFHDYYSDLPPMPEKMTIDPRQASSFQQQYTNESGEKLMKGFNNEQLVCNLYDKQDYCLHNFELKLYLRLGGIHVDKIRAIVSYSQKSFMKEFITRATEMRNSTDDEIIRNYYKLTMNASFGFAGLAIHNFIDCKIIKSRDEALRLISQPNFKGFSILEKSLAVVEMIPVKVVVRNHLLLASAILSRSKWLFYDIYYNGIKAYFSSQQIHMKLLYVDTDSANIHVNCSYEDLLTHLSHIRLHGEKIVDLSFLNADHRLFSTEIKNKIGTLKSETKNVRILAYCCIKKKFYAFKLENAESKLRGKGVPRRVLKKMFRFEDYEQALLSGGITRVRIKLFKRVNQSILAVTQSKIGLCSFSTSRFLLPPMGLTSVPFGHISIVNGEVDSVTEEL